MAAMKKESGYKMKVVQLVAYLFASVLLVSCGESNNLDDPQQVSVVTTCDDLKDIECANGYFIDDVVGNLDYECGKVKSVTDFNGSFACPVGSDVIFSITNPDNVAGKKIVLGKTAVKANARYGFETYLYIRPSSLSSNPVVIKNIARLLQSFHASPAVAGDLDSPARALFIPDADKRKLIALVETVDGTAANNAFESAAFDAAVQPFMTEIDRELADESIVDGLLKKGFYSTVAGLYFNPGFAISLTENTRGSGIDGLSASHYFQGATWTAVDRKGRIFGFGVYATGPASLPANCRFLLPLIVPCEDDPDTASVEEQPPRLSLRMIPEGTTPWPQWKDDNAWAFSYALLDGSNAPIAGSTLTMNGVVDRGAVAGSASIYQNIFGVTATPPLGTWTLTGSPAFSASETAFTLVRSRGVASTLDPNLWRPDTALPATEGLHFPMNLEASFYDSSCSTTTPKPASCPIADTLRFTVLADGNIVSNNNGSCGTGINTTTLMTPNGQEYPLGMVAQIFGSNFNGTTTPGRVYINLILMVPDRAEFPLALRGIQVGDSTDVTGASAGKVRIRVDKIAANPLVNKYLHAYHDADFDANQNSTDVNNSAYWINYGAFLRGQPEFEGFLTTRPDPDPACPAQP